MAINFPASSESPWYNEDNGITYVWYGSYWKALATPTGEFDARYVNVDGDNMTGDLTLSTDKITLDATDGSATFAGGNAEIESNGSYRGKNSGTNNIVLNAVSGNTYFAGLAGINCPGNSNTALVLGNRNTTGASLGIIDNKEGGTGDAVISLNGDGSAEFAGPILFQRPSDNKASFQVGYDEETFATIDIENNRCGFVNQSGGGGSFYSAFNTATDKQNHFGIYDLSNDTVTTRLYGDGSAEFAGKVSVDLTEQNYCFQLKYQGVNRGGLYSSGSGGVLGLHSGLDGYNPDDATIQLNGPDGSAEFAGDVTVGPFAADSGGKGISLAAGGTLQVKRSDDDKLAVFRAYDNSGIVRFDVLGEGTVGIGGNLQPSDRQPLINLDGTDGSAEFAGSVSIGGTDDAHTIDEYEEGVWTVTTFAKYGTNLDIDHNVLQSNYTITGNVVFCQAVIEISGVNTPAGTPVINLPVAALNNDGGTSCTYQSGFASTYALGRVNGGFTLLASIDADTAYRVYVTAQYLKAD